MAQNSIPFGVQITSIVASKCCSTIHFNKPVLFKASILVLTFAAYTCYHMTRKSLSVVKSVLHRNCTDIPRPVDQLFQDPTDNNWCEYPPFDGSDTDAKALFGLLDSAFLFSYAAAMFASGFIAERVSLRYFLAIGMLFSGIFCYLFGMGKVYGIHTLGYFFVVQILAGIFQTTGWPGVVTLVGRWFGKSKRGLIFGIWNSHTSIGNILGTVIAAHYVERDWSMSFIVPGFIMGLVGFVLFLFVVEFPHQVGVHVDGNERRSRSQSEADFVERNETDALLSPHDSSVNIYSGSAARSSQEELPSNRAVGFSGALRIPGVIEFSLCLFFTKLVSYTFLYWLPLYIQSSTSMGAKLSADISTVFDIGGILGAIIAGIVSDYTGMSAVTCSSMLLVTGPLLFFYQQLSNTSVAVNILMLFVCGAFVNGPYALITTAVSAELGQHSSLEGNSKALATVTAIIDGTGSIGAAVGPLLAGMLSDWKDVFYILIASDVIALLLLSRLFVKELQSLRRRNLRTE